MASSVPVPMLSRGFMFSPSDEDLVVRYLRPRAANEPPPCAVIINVEIMCYNPWDLFPEGSKEKYFFTQKELKYKVGTCRNRVTSEGYWRATGTEVPIYTRTGSVHNELVGTKRSLVFYRGHSPNGERTEWTMQEYRLAGVGLNPFRVMRQIGADNADPHCHCAATAIAKKKLAPAAALQATNTHDELTHVMVNPDESWVICRVYKKKSRARRVIVQAVDGWGPPAQYINFMGEANRELSPAASSTTDTVLYKKEDSGSDNKKVCDDNDN